MTEKKKKEEPHLHKLRVCYKTCWYWSRIWNEKGEEGRFKNRMRPVHQRVRGVRIRAQAQGAHTGCRKEKPSKFRRLQSKKSKKKRKRSGERGRNNCGEKGGRLISEGLENSRPPYQKESEDRV